MVYSDRGGEGCTRFSPWPVFSPWPARRRRPRSPQQLQRNLAAGVLTSARNRRARAGRGLHGDNPKGYIMYDGTGHMMVEFEKMPPPPKFASGDDWKPTPDEARAALPGFVAYFGTFTVDEKADA